MSILDAFRPKTQPKARATSTQGVPGFIITSGYVIENEKTGELADSRKFHAYSEMLANVSVVSASIRYFLALAGKSTWTFTPSDADTDGKFAELAEDMLTNDPATSWTRIVKRACLYRFYGFSVQEWTARRREDGVITFADIAPRSQLTIERWDVEPDGTVVGIMQRNPNTSQEIYIPRQKVVYLVDDTLNASPTGLGLFRHLVEPVNRLKRLQQLEMIGYENDLRGIPVARAPYAELAEAVENGSMTAEEAKKVLDPIERFIRNHIKNPALGLSLDSSVYVTDDDKNTPSGTYKFGVELLQGGPTSLEYIASAINRLQKEVARILGTEGIILGDGQAGSMALSKDKSQQLSLMVDGALDEVAYAFRDDLLWPLWQLNGWDEAMMPKMKAASAAFKDLEQITAALRDLATAGAPLVPGDPVIDEVRSLAGLSPQDPALVELEMLLHNADALTADDPEDPNEPKDPNDPSADDPEGQPDEEGDLPEDETKQGKGKANPKKEPKK